MADQGLDIVLFSSLFPNEVDPVFGIFVENRLRHFLADTGSRAVVIAPVPWFPFKGKRWGRYGAFARVPAVEVRHGIPVMHPRYLVIPKVGMWLTPFTLYRAGKRALRRLLKDGGSCDVIDAHYLYPDGVAAAKLARFFDIPFVMTARGSDVTEIGQQQVPGRMIVDAASQAAHVITVSNSLRTDLIAMGVPEDRVTTLRNGVDAGHFRPQRREEFRAKWGGANKIVAFAGWLVQRKRVDIAISAMAHLPEDTALVVAGEGPLHTELLEQAKQLGVADRVIFEGKLSSKDMPGFLSAADVLILPSEREGWANVLLEAMACGTPVVSRAVAGALDLVVVPEAGELVEGDDPAAYAAAVHKIFTRDTDRMQTRAYAEGFDWKEISLGQEQIFKNAASGHA
ncbi:glycosyltransferase [Kordiimonas gwangyangensis]|uniref:glycosyltransferase n=1 Tax=Kordiimonas gwangyangensis TaxID=288022 RepID=UPI00037F5361|nr:glycosyltransferase [Kordiimonas gwangyangensis]